MGKEIRILILEDSPADAELEECELRKAGLVFTSRIVSTKETFLKELNEFSPDIILSDYDLTTFDGLAALIIAKEKCPDVPFILVTGKLGEEFAIEKLKEGATDYVLKGNLKRLAPSVKRALQEAEEITERKRLRKVLQESEKKYRLLAENTNDMITRHLPNGTYLYVSPACRTMFGYEPEELIGTNAFEQMHPEDVQRIITITKEAVRTGRSNVAQYRHRTKDGQYIWVETVGKIVKNKITGDIEDILCVVRDITDRKQAENEVLQTKRDWENIFQAIGNPAMILDPEHNIIVANRVTIEALKLAEDKIKGKKCYELFHNTSEPPEGCPLEKLRTSLHLTNVEMEVEALGGTYLVSCTPIFDEKGNLQKTIHIAIDITRRKQAEQAFRDSEEKYRLVVENANDAIIILQDGKIKFSNHQLIALSGYSEEEVRSVPFSSLIHAGDKDMVMEMHRKRLQGEDIPSMYSFRFINKSGETVWVQVNAVLVPWKGRPAALFFLRDLTIQKKLEEQLLNAQKMEAIGTLAGGIAHDFNNLLMGILGYTSLMLMKTDKNHPFYEKLKTIERQVESGAELTRQLLGFARGGKYYVTPVTVNDLIIETSDIFGSTKKEITIHRKLQEDLHTIEADRGQIEQVLFNLYANAWQAMPSGGRLYIETRNVFLDEQECRTYNVKPGPYVKISVTDTGVGMDAGTRKRIFEPFFSTKGIGKGTGLGLASAYGIIRNHCGIINVYSEKGHGTTFTLHLPASETKAGEPKPAEGSLFTGDETILIVDDEPDIILAVKELLKELGYKILTAQSGLKAIELYRESHGEIKLVILDMIMPEMNGRETLLNLMEIDNKVRVLLSSGYSINGEAAEILDMGCKGFIQKPFRIEEFSRKIRDVLDSGD